MALFMVMVKPRGQYYNHPRTIPLRSSKFCFSVTWLRGYIYTRFTTNGVQVVYYSGNMGPRNL
jgi:hypothetical protein